MKHHHYEVKRMKIKTVLEHSDEVSGTWVMCDGTKCHWTEGRSSTMVCVLPSGESLSVDCGRINRLSPIGGDHAELIGVIVEAMDNGPDAEEWRAMTPEEEAEHDKAMV